VGYRKEMCGLPFVKSGRCKEKRTRFAWKRFKEKSKDTKADVARGRSGPGGKIKKGGRIAGGRAKQSIAYLDQSEEGSGKVGRWSDRRISSGISRIEGGDRKRKRIS